MAKHFLEKSIDWQMDDIAMVHDGLPFFSSGAGHLLLRHVPMIRSGQVLDIGCGTGFPLLELAARFGPGVGITGLDPWAAGAKVARKKLDAYALNHVAVVEGVAEDLPFPDQSFDLVCSNLNIGNLEDRSKGAEEAFRVCKKGARLALTTNLMGTFAEFYDVALEVMAETGRETLVWALSRHMGTRMNPLQVKDLMATAGFRILKSIESEDIRRYSSGTAFFHDPLIVMAFLPIWKSIVPQGLHALVFAQIEARLNSIAEAHGEIEMRVPLLYLEAERPA